MQTKREIIKRRMKVINYHLNRRGYPSITMEQYMELQGALLHIGTLLGTERRTLIEFLYAPSTRKDIDNLIKETDNGFIQLQTIGRWLNGVIASTEKKKSNAKGFVEGIKESKKRLAEVANSIQEYSVSEFAKLAHRHEHTIRTKFHSGELKGRQDSKGIFIAASELPKFKPASTEQE